MLPSSPIIICVGGAHRKPLLIRESFLVLSGESGQPVIYTPGSCGCVDLGCYVVDKNRVLRLLAEEVVKGDVRDKPAHRISRAAEEDSHR